MYELQYMEITLKNIDFHLPNWEITANEQAPGRSDKASKKRKVVSMEKTLLEICMLLNFTSRNGLKIAWQPVKM